MSLSSYCFSVLTSILVLTGVELIFFPVAAMVLCFGFRMSIMLVTQQRLGLLQRTKDFTPHAALPERGWGGGDRTQTAGPHWPKGCPISRGAMPSNKSWGKGGRGDVGSNSICLRRNC